MKITQILKLKYLLAVLILSLVYFILLFDILNNRGELGWDEAARSMGGIVLFKYFTTGMPFNEVVSFIRSNHYYVYQGALLYGPLHAISNLITYTFMGFSVQSARFPSIFFGAATILATYALSRFLYQDERVGFLSALFVFGSPLFFNFSKTNWSQVPVTFCITLGTLTLFVIKKDYLSGKYKDLKGIKGSEKYYIFLGVASGILYALAGLTRPAAIFMTLPIVVYLLQAIITKQVVTKKVRKHHQKIITYGLIPTKQLIIILLPLLLMIIFIMIYWGYMSSLDFLSSQYIPFWTAKMGHGIPEPFSMNIILSFWKPMLVMFPDLVLMLSLVGIFYSLRNKTMSEELFLLLWIVSINLTVIVSGAMSVEYTLSIIPALAVFAASTLVKFADAYNIHYNPVPLFKEKHWKKIIVFILISFILIQSITIPFYQNESAHKGAYIKPSPLVITSILNETMPSLYKINVLTFRGDVFSGLNYGGRVVSAGEIDIYHSLANTIENDIRKNNYQRATVIFMDGIPNYFDYWFTTSDKYLTYRLITGDMVPNQDILMQYLITDRNQIYLIMSQNTKNKIINEKNNESSPYGYYIYKVYIQDKSVDLEKIEIEVIRF